MADGTTAGLALGARGRSQGQAVGAGGRADIELRKRMEQSLKQRREVLKIYR